MKNYIKISLITIGLILLAYSCTDVQGDGIDTWEFQSSQVPENTSYRNPVWNFDLTNASVFLSSGPYYALGDEKEWATGIKYTVPSLTSKNLMSWSLIENGAAFPTKPDWAEGNITSVTGIFAKSLATYFLFYKLGDSDIGAAHARTPQGPYIDYGKVTDQATLGVSGIEDAFVYAFGSTYCLFFTVPGEGIYGIRLNIVKPEPVPILPVTSGNIFKITDDRFSGVFIRKKGSTYWLYATQGSNIVMGKSVSIEGPYVNKDGAALIGNDGANLVIPTDEYSELGQVAGVQSDAAGNDWIIYTAVESKHPELTTGASRYVLMLNQIKTDQDGWPAEQIQAKSGYVTPRFEN